LEDAPRDSRKEQGSLDANASEVPRAAAEEMAQRLMDIMEREIDGVTVPREDAGPDSISRLGLDSLALVGFLVAVEDELRIEWDPDADVEVLRSFDAMARYVLANGGGSRA
jgi:acyl carrier protein